MEVANVDINALIQNTKDYFDAQRDASNPFYKATLSMYQRTSVENVQFPDKATLFALKYVFGDISNYSVESIISYLDRFKIPYVIDADEEMKDKTLGEYAHMEVIC